jgi:hypothetical protein
MNLFTLRPSILSKSDTKSQRKTLDATYAIPKHCKKTMVDGNVNVYKIAQLSWPKCGTTLVVVAMTNDHTNFQIDLTPYGVRNVTFWQTYMDSKEEQKLRRDTHNPGSV